MSMILYTIYIYPHTEIYTNRGYEFIFQINFESRYIYDNIQCSIYAYIYIHMRIKARCARITVYHDIGIFIPTIIYIQECT